MRPLQRYTKNPYHLLTASRGPDYYEYDCLPFVLKTITAKLRGCAFYKDECPGARYYPPTVKWSQIVRIMGYYFSIKKDVKDRIITWTTLNHYRLHLSDALSSLHETSKFTNEGEVLRTLTWALTWDTPDRFVTMCSTAYQTKPLTEQELRTENLY